MKIPNFRQNTNKDEKAISQKVLFQSGSFRVIAGRLGSYVVVKSFRSADQVLTYRPYPPDNTKHFFSLEAAKRFIEEQR